MPTSHEMEIIMDNFFTNPSDLTDAIMEVVNPGPIMEPTMREQLVELVQPGRALCFRTESGSLYDMTVYTNRQTALHKVDQETDGINLVATGELIGVHDRERGVYGIRIEEPGGRTYTTSAVVKAWLSYDAVANTFHQEP